MKPLREIVNSERLVPLIVLFLSLYMLTNISAATDSDEIRVTLLGTGTPFPNAERFGLAILVEVAGREVAVRLRPGSRNSPGAGSRQSERDRRPVSSLIFTRTMSSGSLICGCRDGC